MTTHTAAPARPSTLRFEQYVVPELDALRRLARSLTYQPVDADDLVQDTLVRAYRAIDRFDGAYPRAWLFTIMRNSRINTVRRRAEVLLDPGGIADDASPLVPSADGPDPEAHVVDRCVDPALADALDRLPPQMRAVVMAVAVERRTCRETAETLSIPLGTVLSRMHRARASIRRSLEPEGWPREREVTREA